MSSSRVFNNKNDENNVAKKKKRFSFLPRGKKENKERDNKLVQVIEFICYLLLRILFNGLKYWIFSFKNGHNFIRR